MANFDELTIRRLKMYGESSILLNQTGEDLSETLTNLLCDENNIVTIIDARTILDKHDIRQRFNQVPQGYILFTHVVDAKLDDMVAEQIRYCVKKNFMRNYDDTSTIYPDDWETHLAHTKLGVFILVEPGQEQDKWLRQVAISTGCGILTINKQGFLLR